MRFLHLSDLHVGKCENSFFMLDEQRCVFGQVVGFVRFEVLTLWLLREIVFD